jgi:signal peptidase I
MKGILQKRLFVPVAAALAAGLLLRVFVFDVFRVEGRSMEPALRAGSVLLVNRAAYGLRNPLTGGYLVVWASPREDEILVYEDPRDGNFKIKRCAGISGAGVYMRGDNSGRSMDSRIYGSLPAQRIAGKVLIALSGNPGFRITSPEKIFF